MGFGCGGDDVQETQSREINWDAKSFRNRHDLLDVFHNLLGRDPLAEIEEYPRRTYR